MSDVKSTEVANPKADKATQDALKEVLKKEKAGYKKTPWRFVLRPLFLLSPYLPFIAQCFDNEPQWASKLANGVSVLLVSVFLFVSLAVTVSYAANLFMCLIAPTPDDEQYRSANNIIAGTVVTLGIFRPRTFWSWFVLVVYLAGAAALYAADHVIGGYLLMLAILFTSGISVVCQAFNETWLENLTLKECHRLMRRPWETKDTSEVTS